MKDFLKYRYICFAASVVILALGFTGYFLNNGFKYAIDFAGGTELVMNFSEQSNVQNLRNTVIKLGWDDVVIQAMGSESKEFLVRVGDVGENLETRFNSALSKELGENSFTISKVERIGPEAGKEVRWNAIKAIFISMILLLFYLAIRSQYAYALGAVTALAHDLLAILSFILITGEPVSLTILAAILAILGYSLNDTIVIFSRVRENMGHMKGSTPFDVVNASLSQTLRRTLLTSFSTLVAIFSLLILGGETLQGFAKIMLVGIAVGTYSSVYIASPVMLAFSKELKEQEV